MTNADYVSNNLSLSESSLFSNRVNSPLKRNAIMPFELPRIPSPEPITLKQSPMSVNLSTSHQQGLSLLKDSKNLSSSTVAPSDLESDLNVRKLKKDVASESRLRTGSVTSESGGNKKSILKKSRYANSEKTGRKESSETRKKRRKSHHKINFKEELFEVRVVENWKEYNSNENSQSCHCNLF